MAQHVETARDTAEPLDKPAGNNLNVMQVWRPFFEC